MKRVVSVAAAGLLLAAGQAFAEGPAVDGINGKLTFSGGAAERRGIDEDDNLSAVGIFEGSLSVPVTHRFGAQADVATGIIGGNPFVGIGGHFFRRDPQIGLIGAFGQWAHLRGSNLYRVGGEGEYYMGRWTAGARVGAQFGNDSRRGLLVVPHGPFGRATIAWYPMDDLMIQGGVAITPLADENFEFQFNGRVEWQMARQSAPGLTLFVDGWAGTYNNYSVVAGVRWHFRFSGERDKSLIRRHREDDPQTLHDGEPITNGWQGRNPVVRRPRSGPRSTSCPPGTSPTTDGRCIPI